MIIIIPYFYVTYRPVQVKNLEEKYYSYKGLNLTIETLDGLIKHNGPIHNTLRFDKILKINNFKNKINFSRFPHLESQVSSISDDIAYNNHDIEDGIRAGLFSVNEIIEIPFFYELFGKNKRNNRQIKEKIIISQMIRESINHMVVDVIKNAKMMKEKIIAYQRITRNGCSFLYL